MGCLAYKTLLKLDYILPDKKYIHAHVHITMHIKRVEKTMTYFPKPRTTIF